MSIEDERAALRREGWCLVEDEEALMVTVVSLGLPTRTVDLGAFSRGSSFRTLEVWAPLWVRALSVLIDRLILDRPAEAFAMWTLGEVIPRILALPDRDEVLAAFTALMAGSFYDAAETYLRTLGVLPPPLTTPTA